MSLENLRDLRLSDHITNLSNPICMARSYKEEVLALFPSLTSLDGIEMNICIYKYKLW